MGFHRFGAVLWVCALGWGATVQAEPAPNTQELRLPADDPRTPIHVIGEDRAWMLGQMRLFLAALGQINGAIASGDRAEVARTARRVGMKIEESEPYRPSNWRSLTPPGWGEMARTVRLGFDRMADQAATASPENLNAELAEQVQICVACHQTFRVAD